MADISDIPMATRALAQQLFQSQNFCFATTTAARTPTFYFAQGGLHALNNAALCGRLRTQHGHGPLVDITTNIKQHLFFPTLAARNAAYNALPGVAGAAGLAALVAASRQVPQDRDFHLEFSMVPAHGHPYSRRHPSGGNVDVGNRIHTNAKCIAIVNYILSRNGTVRLNRAVQPMPAGGAPAAAIAAIGVGPFLAAL